MSYGDDPDAAAFDAYITAQLAQAADAYASLADFPVRVEKAREVVSGKSDDAAAADD